MNSSSAPDTVRAIFAILSLAFAAICSAAPESFDLSKVVELGGKGRVQDQQPPMRDPQITIILGLGKDAIPLLIEAIESERPYAHGHTPIPLWPEMVEGDIALIILSDLFLDPTWKRSTLPSLCFDNVIGRTSRDTPAWGVLRNFVQSNGRAELAKPWREAWAREGSQISWDSAGQYFRVEGRDPIACTPNNSPEPARAK